MQFTVLARRALTPSSLTSTSQRGRSERRFGSKIGENYAAQLLNFISRVTNPLSEGTVGRLAGHFQDPPFDIIKPSVVAATQPAILQVAEFQRGSAMRAAQRQQSQPILLVAKENKIFA